MYTCIYECFYYFISPFLNILLVAAPSVVKMAINGLTYQSIAPNVQDNITITFFDGAVITYIRYTYIHTYIHTHTNVGGKVPAKFSVRVW